jgi:hypothetical protein
MRTARDAVSRAARDRTPARYEAAADAMERWARADQEAGRFSRARTTLQCAVDLRRQASEQRLAKVSAHQRAAMAGPESDRLRAHQVRLTAEHTTRRSAHTDLLTPRPSRSTAERSAGQHARDRLTGRIGLARPSPPDRSH